MKKKFYETKLFTILLLILFFPVGIYLMFKNNHFSKPIRATITVIFAILLIGGIFAPEKPETTSKKATSKAKKEEAAEEPKKETKKTATKKETKKVTE